jgi:prolyl-tRNA editing enzyme YbaK/EbsC (Cys-tRNA(Pro) deacylase)
MVTNEQHEIAPRDVVEVAGRRVGEAPRLGEVLEVLRSGDRVHYRVRWDDGHESIFYPSSDTTLRPAPPRATTARGAATESLVELLREAEVEFELLPHARTLTAKGEARALGVLPQETAKTVIATAGGRFVRAVVCANDRVNLHKLAAAAGAPELALADESELALAYPQFELGAVPPFGGPAGDDVVVDERLTACEYVVLEAGAHDTSLRLRPDDLIAVSSASVGDIAAVE